MVRLICSYDESFFRTIFDWRCDIIANSLDRCTNLTALDLSVGSAGVPYSDLPCFTLVSGMGVREQHFWKKTDPYYSLKHTLGLDEGGPEKKLRLYRLYEPFYRNMANYADYGLGEFKLDAFAELHSDRTKDHWADLILTAMKNATNWALDRIIADISKVNGAWMLKFMRVIHIMANITDDDNSGSFLEIMTDKLSWILAKKFKDDPMRAELGRQLAKLLNSDWRMLKRALELYDTERVEFCLRNGLMRQQDTCFYFWEPCFIYWVNGGSIVRNILTYLNFGVSMIDELNPSLHNFFLNQRISLFIETYLLQERFANVKVHVEPRLRKYFWFAMTYQCFDSAYETFSFEEEEIIEERSSPAVPERRRCTEEEWLNAARYFWRAILCPYLTKPEFLEFCIVDVLNEERRYDRFCQLVYEEELHERPSPRSLQQHCRVAVRQQLLKKDNDLVRLIDGLEVPAWTKMFLKLQF